MLLEARAGPYTIRGISVAGVYTSLQVPELDAVLDVGLPIRTFVGSDRIFLSHTHADHASAIGSLLGIRNLIGKGAARIFVPRESALAVRDAIDCLARLHHTTFDAELVAMEPGNLEPLGHGLSVRAFRTHHPAPSLGYAFVRSISKLRPEFRELPGPEIARRRQQGDSSLFELTERVELAYATDTRASVLDSEPWLYGARVLVLECTYLDPSRTVEEARARGHLHLDELVARAERFSNEALVLMHFSQIHSPRETHAIVGERLRGRIAPAVHVLAPTEGPWFG